MDGKKLKEVAEKALGNNWKRKIQARFGVTERTIQRWTSGETAVPVHVENWLESEQRTIDVRIPVNERVFERLSVESMAYGAIRGQTDRFEWDDENQMSLDSNGMPALPDDGTVIWTEGYIDALIVKSWLEANHYTAYTGWDAGRATNAIDNGETQVVAWIVVTNKSMPQH